MEDCKRGRKTEKDSLYSQIDSILEFHNIQRAAYHGGDLTGGCVKNLMSHSKEIMDKVSVLLKQNKSPLCTMSDNDIDELCNNSCTLLILWDGAMAVLHTEFPREEDCDKAQQFIDAALELTRKMNMTVTPKSHGGEAHLVKQMRATKGGLFEHDESWGEQYHQVGHHFDMRLRNQGSGSEEGKD